MIYAGDEDNDDNATSGLACANCECVPCRCEDDDERMERKPFPAPRTCEGCKRTKGTTAIALSGYWHPRCWRKATDDQRKAARERMAAAAAVRP